MPRFLGFWWHHVICDGASYLTVKQKQIICTTLPTTKICWHLIAPHPNQTSGQSRFQPGARLRPVMVVRLQ